MLNIVNKMYVCMSPGRVVGRLIIITTTTIVSVTSITSHGGRIIGNTHNGQTELYTLDTHWIEKIT